MKTLSELQIIAEGKYPYSNDNGSLSTLRIAVQNDCRAAYIQGCLDTQEESGWVGVEKRLPEFGVNIIVHGIPKHIIMEGVSVRIDRRVDTSGFNEHQKRLVTERNGFLNMSEVTHWQPLPNPPKEK